MWWNYFLANDDSWVKLLRAATEANIKTESCAVSDNLH